MAVDIGRTERGVSVSGGRRDDFSRASVMTGVVGGAVVVFGQEYDRYPGVD